MVLAVPAMHGFPLPMLLRAYASLVCAMFMLPAVAIMIADLFMKFSVLVFAAAITIFCRRAYGCC